ncbi:hypothetical protein [Synechococcus sp. UW140]|uniref:hypothetical protein n=1 Tax=Synechococcus sp. UW140 TaxID=368503 RepID=UPI0031382491
MLRAKQAPEHIREAWVGTSWIVEVTASGSRDSKPFQAQQLFLTSLRTTPQALLKLVRDRWSIEGDARHHGPAGDDQAEVSAQPMLRL